MSKLIVLRAAPGTGKTTVANILHNESVEPTVLLPKDTFAIDITKDEKSLRQPMKDSYFFALRSFLSAEAVVIAEGAFNSEHWHKSFQKLEKVSGANTYHFFLTAPIEEVRERARGRKKSDVVTVEYVEELYGRARPLGWENETVIDTTTFDSPHHVAEHIAGIIGMQLEPGQEKGMWYSHSFLRQDDY